MRTTRSLFAVAGGLLLMLAACGGSSDEGSTGPSPSATSSAAGEGGPSGPSGDSNAATGDAGSSDGSDGAPCDDNDCKQVEDPCADPLPPECDDGDFQVLSANDCNDGAKCYARSNGCGANIWCTGPSK